MKFITRGLWGLLVFGCCMAILGAGAWRVHSALTNTSAKRKPPASERSYAVQTGVLKAQKVRPVITTFGTIRAWRTLEIRAAAAGPITHISANFRDGADVVEGDLLFRIDPEAAERRVEDAKASLAQAEAEHREATAMLDYLRADVAAIENYIVLRRQDVERKQQLRRRKLVTQPVLDTAILAVSGDEQSLIAKRQSLLTGTVRVEKAQREIEHTLIALRDAEQARERANYKAPFTGRLTDVSATLGRRVGQNEQLGLLIDPDALEVAFRVRDVDFGRMLGKSGQKLAPLRVKVTLNLGSQALSLNGTLDRPAAVVDQDQGGRTVFARLTDAAQSSFRPGDFVTVSIEEPPLENVAVIPARAATGDGRILLINEDDRLQDILATVLRRQDRDLVVTGVPFGRRYVRVRLPHLAEGIKIKSLGTQDQDKSSRPGSAGDMVSLTDKRRKALIAAVKSSQRIPEVRKLKILTVLSHAEAPRTLVERIERRAKRQGKRS